MSNKHTTTTINVKILVCETLAFSKTNCGQKKRDRAGGERVSRRRRLVAGVVVGRLVVSGDVF